MFFSTSTEFNVRVGHSNVWKPMGYLETLEISWEGSKGHWRRCCHVKAYAWDFQMAHLQIGSKSRSRDKIPRWLSFSELKFWDGSKFETFKTWKWISFRILSHLRILGLKKWAISEFFYVTTYASDFERAYFQIENSEIAQNSAFRNSWILHHLKVVCICRVVSKISFENVESLTRNQP